MIIRKIKIENYTTGKTKHQEVTTKQHEQILKEIAEKRLPLEVNIIHEREL